MWFLCLKKQTCRSTKVTFRDTNLVMKLKGSIYCKIHTRSSREMFLCKSISPHFCCPHSWNAHDDKLQCNFHGHIFQVNNWIPRTIFQYLCLKYCLNDITGPQMHIHELTTLAIQKYPIILLCTTYHTTGWANLGIRYAPSEHILLWIPLEKWLWHMCANMYAHVWKKNGPLSFQHRNYVQYFISTLGDTTKIICSIYKHITFDGNAEYQCSLLTCSKFLYMGHHEWRWR